MDVVLRKAKLAVQEAQHQSHGSEVFTLGYRLRKVHTGIPAQWFPAITGRPKNGKWWKKMAWNQRGNAGSLVEDILHLSPPNRQGTKFYQHSHHGTH
jgi:hypothetical protein